MPALSMVKPSRSSRADTAAATSASPPAPAGTKNRPGFVQNWPAPSVIDPARPVPISPPRSSAAARVTTSGLAAPSSPKKGIGTDRALARSHSARPAATEPVKPAALTAGASTSATPASKPKTRLRVPSGASQRRAPRSSAAKVAALVAGWAGWAFTTTGHPAARADAVSPPGTEKAKGKLELPYTATTPSGTLIRRRSGSGPMGESVAWSMVASRNAPSVTTSAKKRSWKAVRRSSPWRRAGGNAVSSAAVVTRSSPSASSSSPIARSISARHSSGRCE